MSSFNHSICEDCWNERNPNHLASARAKDTEQKCCFCGRAGREFRRFLSRETIDIIIQALTVLAANYEKVGQTFTSQRGEVLATLEMMHTLREHA